MVHNRKIEGVLRNQLFKNDYNFFLEYFWKSPKVHLLTSKFFLIDLWPIFAQTFCRMLMVFQEQLLSSEVKYILSNLEYFHRW